MPFRHISYGSEFGIALHETGLNSLSAGLRAQKPELFAFKTEIPIVRPSGGDPGHILTLYAVADEPIAFNLYPVQATPAIAQDGFFIAANILFTLTDSRLGAVTRIRIKVEAGGQIVRRGEQLNVRLLPKSDGTPWFDITSVEGEHPGALRLLDGQIDGDIELTEIMPIGGDEETARSFRAIMNYLITLFLKEGLTRVVTEFPLPSLANLIDAGPLGTIPGRDLYVRNDAIYLTLGGANPGDGGFPAPFPQSDIAIGVSENGLQRVMDAMSPMPIRIDLGTNNTTLRVWSDDFVIRKIKVNLLPGLDHLFGQVYFGGSLFIRLQFKTPWGKWVRADLPLPIDSTLSQYAGLIRPYLAVVDPGTAGERFELRMEPDSRFFELWGILIVTNYRGLFRELFRDLVDKIKDKLIYKKFKKIPVIGWILDKVLDITADVLAWVLGAVFDSFMSGVLTTIMNTVGRIALQFMKRQEFTVLKIEQSKIKEMTGLKIRSGTIQQLDDGRGGELFVGLSFLEGQFPAPPPPTPIPAEPPPQPLPEDGPVPPAPSLPEYGPNAFQPVFDLPTPAWSNGLTERFEVESTGSRAVLGSMELRYEQVAGGWVITKTTKLEGMATSAVVIAQYSAEGHPLKASYRQESSLTREGDAIEFEQAIDFSIAGSAFTSATIGPAASFERTINVLDRARLDFDELWPFRLAHASLNDGASGIFGRIEFADPLDVSNWARQIPVAIRVTETSVSLPDEPAPVPAFTVGATDEDGRTRIIIAPGHGLVELKVTTANGDVTIRRLW